MNQIAADFAAHQIGSIFLYTNEAHPGESYPHLTSMDQKYRHARALRDELGVNRPILLDALDGPCHRAFGSMPNMTWIFNKTGIPLYKSDWTDAASVANALEYFLGVAQRRKEGKRLAPFSVERLDFREQDRDAFYQRLAVNGPKAVKEFRKAFGNH
jgi:hypothetical protein